MARQGLPAHHDRAPARRLSEVVIVVLLSMALRERRHSAERSGGGVQAVEYIRLSTVLYGEPTGGHTTASAT